MAVLTISRELGSGGREIGHAVSRLLGYEYIDKERVLADIRTAGGKWEEWGKEFDEHCPTVWERYDWSFRAYTALLQSRIFEYALGNNAVIMGRGGNLLLAGIPYALRIRVVAPIEQKVERVMKRESVDAETARWLVEKTDRERECQILAMYGRKWDEKGMYDMVFDTGLVTIKEITDIAVRELSKMEALRTAEAEEVLRLRATAAKVRAGIASDPGFFVPTLDVFCDGKDIVVKGVIHSPDEHRRLEESARRLAGDVPVRCKLHYRK